jgi:CheY-like chemotaxis protein
MDDPAGPPPRKLLLVEDDFYIRDIYKVEAKDRGYVVYEAADGSDALNMAKIARPDIILLDIMLPKINGLDVLKTLKSWPEFKDTPVIIVSNVGDSQVHQKALQAGAADYLTKFNNTPQKIMECLQKYEHPVVVSAPGNPPPKVA